MTEAEKIAANKELVRLWIEEGWNNNRNDEVIDQVFASNWVDGNPMFHNQPSGIEGARHFVQQYRSALSDINFKVTHVIADPDYVMFRFELSATHTGALLGIPATGRQISTSGIVIHKVVDGRFAESWNEIDLMSIRAQLNV